MIALENSDTTELVSISESPLVNLSTEKKTIVAFHLRAMVIRVANVVVDHNDLLTQRRPM